MNSSGGGKREAKNSVLDEFGFEVDALALVDVDTAIAAAKAQTRTPCHASPNILPGTHVHEGKSADVGIYTAREGAGYDRAGAVREICHAINAKTLNAVSLPSRLYTCGIPLCDCSRHGGHDTAAGALSCEKSYASREKSYASRENSSDKRQAKRVAFRPPIHRALTVESVTQYFDGCAAFRCGQVLFCEGSALSEDERTQLNAVMEERRRSDNTTAPDVTTPAPQGASSGATSVVAAVTCTKSLSHRLSSTVDTNVLPPNEEIRTNVAAQVDVERAEWEGATGEPLSEAAETRLTEMGCALEEQLKTQRDTVATVGLLKKQVTNHEERLETLEGCGKRQDIRL